MCMLGVFILMVCLQVLFVYVQVVFDFVLLGQVLGDFDQIVWLMVEWGMFVIKGMDVQGLLMLESCVDDMLFNVYFYDCDMLCCWMQFVISFCLIQLMIVEDVNDWNCNNFFGKVVIVDFGDFYIEMDIGVVVDGFGCKNFDDVLDIWCDVLGEFCVFFM